MEFGFDDCFEELRGEQNHYYNSTEFDHGVHELGTLLLVGVLIIQIKYHLPFKKPLVMHLSLVDLVGAVVGEAGAWEEEL